MELLFTYSFAKRRESRRLSIHPLVLRWAKERLETIEKIQTARDAVIVAAEFNHRNRKDGKWITLDFAEHYNLMARSTSLIHEYLNESLETSADWALLLAIESLAMDLFYSKMSQIAGILIQYLFKNARMQRRAFEMALVVTYYTPTKLFPPGHFSQPDWAGSAVILSRSEQAELVWLWKVASGNATFDDTEAEAFFSRLDKTAQANCDVVEILRNITRLETYFKRSFRHQDELEEKRSELKRVISGSKELFEQVPDFVKSKLVAWTPGLSLEHAYYPLSTHLSQF